MRYPSVVFFPALAQGFSRTISETSKLTIKATARGEDGTVKRKGAVIFSKNSVVPTRLSHFRHHILFLKAKGVDSYKARPMPKGFGYAVAACYIVTCSITENSLECFWIDVSGV